MSDDTDYNADTLRQLADRMDTLEAWLPDGVDVTLTSGGVDALVVELVDGDDHYGSIDPSVLVGVGADDGPLKASDAEFIFENPSVTFSIKEPEPTPAVTPLVERVTGERKRCQKGVARVTGGTIEIGLSGREVFNLFDDGSTSKGALEHGFLPVLNTHAWDEDMRAVELETERRVPEVGEWYRGTQTGDLNLRVSEVQYFDPKRSVVCGADKIDYHRHDVVTEPMQPYLFGGTDE